MLDSLKTPWWRLPLTLVGGGVVLIAIDVLIGLNWIPFLVGLALVVYGVFRLSRGEVESGPRLLLAACAGAIVAIAGLGWLHPQSWLQPGWSLPDGDGVLVGRSGGVVVFAHGHHYGARNLENGDLLWSERFTQPVSVYKNHLLVQRVGNPDRAKAYFATTGEFDRVLRWHPPSQTDDTAPTADQLAVLPALGSDEHVRAQETGDTDLARLVSAVDITGHRFTRLDVVADGTLAQYRVRGATGLEVRHHVVIVEGSAPRVVPVIR